MRVIFTDFGWLKGWKKNEPIFTANKEEACHLTIGLAAHYIKYLKQKELTPKQHIIPGKPVKYRGKVRFDNLTADEKKMYIESLVEIESKLKEAGYQMFLVYGGLLAGIREKDLIDWDKDIDVAVLAKSESNYNALRIELSMISELFPYIKSYGKRAQEYWGGLRFTAWINKKEAEFKRFYIDVYLAYPDPLNPDHYAISNYFLRDFKVDGKTITRFCTSVPKGWLRPFRRSGELQGAKFMVPRKPETCLTVWYGNWKVPFRGKYFTSSRLNRIRHDEQKLIEVIKKEK